jgi:glycosyltransferase involved in cell wall biosynthesis
MMQTKPHICFVSPAIYPVFAGSRSVELVGGAEVQQSALANVFAEAGYRVSIVTLDYGQDDGVVINGVTVYRAHSPTEGIPGLRFVHPRATGLWRAMKRADAQLYYQRGSGMLTGLVAQFCRMNRRHFLFAAASDADFLPELPLLSNRRDRWLYRRGLRMADHVVVQSLAQQRQCASHFARGAAIVPSCMACTDSARRDRGGYVLWVANMRHLKRPKLLLDLAVRLPDLPFRVIGGHGDIGLFEQFAAAARHVPNIEFVGYRPYADMAAEFDGARILVNTSEIEGFPNTFLQAWSRGIPVVSFFDVGTQYEGKPVLQAVADLPHMIDRVASLMSDDVLWRRAGDLSRACYLHAHTPAAALQAYEQVLQGGNAAGQTAGGSLLSRGRA